MSSEGGMSIKGVVNMFLISILFLFSSWFIILKFNLTWSEPLTTLQNFAFCLIPLFGLIWVYLIHDQYLNYRWLA